MRWFRRRQPKIDEPSATSDVVKTINEDLRDWKFRLDNMPPYSIVAFDKQMRQSMPWWLSQYTWRPKEFSHTMSRVKDSVTLAKLASMHPDGHIRESASRRLAETYPNGRTLQWLLLRCNDWVPEVRAVALEALTSSSTIDVQDLAICIALIPTEAKDPHAKDVFNSLRERLKQPKAIPMLKRIASGGVPNMVTAATGILLESISPLELLDSVNMRMRVSLRLIAYAGLADPTVCEEIAHRLTSHKLHEMRALGLWHLIDHDHIVDHKLIATSLADGSIFVRVIAQRHFKAIGNDCHAFYVDLLNQDETAGLLGLGDCGSNNDLERAITYADSELIATRHAALRIIASFGDLDNVELLIKHASSDSGAPARQAIRGILRLGLNRDIASIYWQNLCRENDPRAWPRFFGKALSASSKWIAIEFGLRGCNHENHSVKTFGVDAVTSTLERVGESHISAPPKLIPELNDFLAKSKQFT